MPTSRATRVTSAAKAFSWSTMVLIVFFELEDFAFHVHGDLPRQVAAGDNGGHFRDVADLGRDVAAHGVDRIGQVFPGAGHPGTTAWTPSRPSVPTSRATRVTSEAKEREAVRPSC